MFLENRLVWGLSSAHPSQRKHMPLAFERNHPPTSPLKLPPPHLGECPKEIFVLVPISTC